MILVTLCETIASFHWRSRKEPILTIYDEDGNGTRTLTLETCNYVPLCATAFETDGESEFWQLEHQEWDLEPEHPAPDEPAESIEDKAPEPIDKK